MTKNIFTYRFKVADVKDHGGLWSNTAQSHNHHVLSYSLRYCTCQADLIEGFNSAFSRNILKLWDREVRVLAASTCSFYANYVLRHVLKRRIQGAVCQRGLERLTNRLPAKMMAKQLRAVQLNVRLEETGRRSTKERVNAKGLGRKWFGLERAGSLMWRFLDQYKRRSLPASFQGIVLFIYFF